ncbi:putative 7-carboxy-7-deazaguanine synthase QueE [Anaerosacchariphilus polymeriproducens]|uniref:7-carboxy-7-deazaguanine synthase n=1 Tax=Anaerosacchariphilus polymeriproducens TaxID=1812858 RepID=A0A371AXK4_9FIRM|nr:putative 7-carboxy-7-deazaguanine synthase QueE [Anaerosacchariphilus polymeriproducens]RDU24289.1 putative 7-carboxy-7-deazaguanine synthase QueE [Anaerosacchariphilus polymeriproducens]
MEYYQIAERFVSINGEGIFAGQLAVFVRFKGCNLHCSYCDTLWANQKDCGTEELTREEIADYIKSTGIHHVTLTGGEPLLQNNIIQLIESLLEVSNVKIEIETNGSIDLLPIKQRFNERVTLTMDYKLPSSRMEQYMKIENLSSLQKEDVVKFVVSTIADLEHAKQVIYQNRLLEKTNVYISPVYGKIQLEDIVEWMKMNQLNKATLQMQLHKIIWGSEAKGV